MPRPHGIDVDRVLAWCCVLIAHLLALWWLTRPHAATQPGIESDGLDVVWIEPARPVAPMPPADVPSQPASSATASVQDEADRRVEAPSTATPATEAVVDPDPAPALSAVFIEQGREWARQ